MNYDDSETTLTQGYQIHLYTTGNLFVTTVVAPTGHRKELERFKRLDKCLNRILNWGIQSRTVGAVVKHLQKQQKKHLQASKK